MIQDWLRDSGLVLCAGFTSPAAWLAYNAPCSIKVATRSITASSLFFSGW